MGAGECQPDKLKFRSDGVWSGVAVGGLLFQEKEMTRRKKSFWDQKSLKKILGINLELDEMIIVLATIVLFARLQGWI